MFNKTKEFIKLVKRALVDDRDLWEVCIDGGTYYINNPVKRAEHLFDRLEALERHLGIEYVPESTAEIKAKYKQVKKKKK